MHAFALTMPNVSLITPIFGIDTPPSSQLYTHDLYSDEPVVEEVSLKQCKNNILEIKKQYFDLEMSISVRGEFVFWS